MIVSTAGALARNLGLPRVNLHSESLQDTAVYDEKSKSSGFSVSVPITGGSFGGSISSGKTEIASNFHSVTEQSGIKAGDGGFQIEVGGVISSTQAAVDAGKNSLVTSCLITSDLQNSSQASAESSGFGLSTDLFSQGKYGMSKGIVSNALNTTDESAQGSGVTLTSRDASSANGVLTNTLSLVQAQQMEQNRVKAQQDAQATVLTTSIGANAWGDYAQAQYDKAVASDDKEGAKNWSEGGPYRVAGHIVIGAVTGGSDGAAGAGTAALAAPLLDNAQASMTQHFINNGMDPRTAEDAARAITSGGAVLLGNAAGGPSGGVTALNVDTFNRQLHATEKTLARQLAARSGGRYTVEQIEDAMRNSGNSARGEDINYGSIVTSNDEIRDDGAQFTAGQDGRSAVQVPPNGGKVDPQLAAFIQNNTGGGATSPYSWSPVQMGTTTAPVPNPNAGLNTMTPAGNGCVTAECSAGTGPVRDPIRDSQDVRNDVAQGATATGRVASIVSNTATAAAVVPGPHQPGATAVAVGATAVDFGSKVVEQIAIPDVGKGAVELGTSWLGEKVTNRASLAAPLINEIMENVKNSPEIQQWQRIVNDAARGGK